MLFCTVGLFVVGFCFNLQLWLRCCVDLIWVSFPQSHHILCVRFLAQSWVTWSEFADCPADTAAEVFEMASCFSCQHQASSSMGRSDLGSVAIVAVALSVATFPAD